MTAIPVRADIFILGLALLVAFRIISTYTRRDTPAVQVVREYNASQVAVELNSESLSGYRIRHALAAGKCEQSLRISKPATSSQLFSHHLLSSCVLLPC